MTGQQGNGTEPDTSQDAGAGRDDQIESLRRQVADLEDRWRRALADFDNLRKRVAGEAARQRSDERAAVAARWLPVLDNLELALQHAAADPGRIVPGVQAVHEQALSVLADLGFPRRADLNEPFDPALHEAVATQPDPDAAPGTIVQVIRPGYGGADRPLRPASVVVAKGA
jgi:molecular chaperone GrpE